MSRGRRYVGWGLRKPCAYDGVEPASLEDFKNRVMAWRLVETLTVVGDLLEGLVVQDEKA